MRLIFKIIFISLCSLTTNVFASDLISLDLSHASLTETLYLFAKTMHQNVILSPTIQGDVSLHVNDADPDAAFKLLMMTQGLGRLKLGNVWFIASRNELMARQQEEVKWQELQDTASPLATEVWPIHYSKAADIAALLQDDHAGLLTKRGSLRVDTRTNVLCVQDIPEKLALMHQLIKQLDVPVKQILIEARLASVDSDFEQELGFDFATKQNDEQSKTMISKGRYSLAYIKLADGSALDIKLAALENKGHAELISSPSLFTANQQTASIEAGEEVPYQEVSESGGTAVTFKKAVLGLRVTPQVLPNHQILLSLQISQDRPSNKMVLGVPTISTRQIVTNVLVKDRQTIVLGGIYETNHEHGESRIPFLSEIPFIGELFKLHMNRDNKRELLIFVTPKIITAAT